MPTAKEIRVLYGLAKGLNMITDGSRDDDLHAVVFAVTGENSIKGLSDSDYQRVKNELLYRLKTQSLEEPPLRKAKAQPVRLSQKQIACIWAMMYELQSYDTKPCTKSLADRLRGIIKKELHIDCIDKKDDKNAIFRWLTQNNGRKLIEVLKGYIESAKRKAKRSG